MHPDDAIKTDRHHNQTRQGGCNGRPLDSKTQAKNEDRVEQCVDRRANERDVHRPARITCRAQYRGRRHGNGQRRECRYEDQQIDRCEFVGASRRAQKFQELRD